MIKKLRLRNFKCYKDKSFELGSLTVFCGNNSVGKSTAIQSILMAIQAGFSLDGVPFNGEFISVGSYNDLHKRNEDEDTLFFEVGNEQGVCSWGYDLDDLESEHYESDGYDHRKATMKDQPLPFITKSGDGCDSIKLNIKNNFQYLSAERLGPKSNYPYSTQRRSKNWLGIQGEYAAQVLSNIEGLGDLPTGDLRIHETALLPSISHNIFQWLGIISPGAFVNTTPIEQAEIATAMFEFGDGEKYRPINVGFGLSYSLPVVMALLMAKPGGLVIIENPEAHLHPKGQSYLGRLIQKTADSGVQIIIETHSDHILNGIRVAAKLSESYVDSSARIFFISAGEEQSEVEELPIDVEGEIPFWPDGFFDQQALDVKSIMLGQNVTRMPKRKSRER